MIKNLFSIFATMLVVLFLSQTPSFASYREGVIAYKKGDFKAAFQIWEPLAQKDDPKAQFKLAGMYAIGKGVEKNILLAFNWYTKSAFNGHKRAAYNKAYMLSNGIGTKKDKNEAFKIYHRLASSNQMVEAQHAVGHSYAHGNGIRKDYKSAKKWYEKAAFSNFVVSQLALSDLLLTSSDPTQRVMAIFWVEVACIQGNGRAMTRAKNFSKNGVDEASLTLHYENAKDWLKDSYPSAVPKFEKCSISEQLSAPE